MKVVYRYLLLILIFPIWGCQNDTIEKITKEKEGISIQLKSTLQELDSIKTSSPFLFEKALNEEISDLSQSIKTYEEIAKTDSISYWRTLAERKITEFQELHDTTKKYVKNLFRLSDTLRLTHLNDKCGEWGGDYEVITITLKNNYKKEMYEGDLYGQYTKFGMNCENIEEPKKVVVKTGQKKLSTNEGRLIKECIEDLLKHKLNNTNLIYHAGILNSVILKDGIAFVNDPAIVISDYPSFWWTNFHKLKKEIIRK